MSHTKLTGVSKAFPCLVCNKTSSCTYGSDGLLMCRHRSGDQPGFVHYGPAKHDPAQRRVLDRVRYKIGNGPLKERAVGLDRRRRTPPLGDTARPTPPFPTS